MPATIQDVFRQFNPTEALEADDPRYVDCNQVRGIPSIFQQLSLPLLDPPPRTLLFSGHVGDGKTTLLKQLQRKLELDGYFVAFLQVDDRLNVGDVEAEDVTLLVLAVVDQLLHERYGATLQDGLLQQRLQALWDLLTREISPTIKIETSIPLVKLMADLKAATGIRQELRARLKLAQGPTFLEVANQYLERARQIGQDQGHKQLVVILDGFDRLVGRVTPDVSLEQRLLLDQSSQMDSIDAHLIYTISLSLARRQHENLRARYGHSPITAPLIPTFTRGGQPHVEGLNALKEIIARRLQQAGTTLEQAFDSVATLERLCQANGGYLRGLLTLVRSACAEALTIHPELPLTDTDVERAIQQFGAPLRDNAQRYLKELQTVLETHSLAAIADEVQQILLDRYLVLRYFEKGEYWYDVCLPVKEHLHGRSI